MIFHVSIFGTECPFFLFPFHQWISCWLPSYPPSLCASFLSQRPPKTGKRATPPKTQLTCTQQLPPAPHQRQQQHQEQQLWRQLRHLPHRQEGESQSCPKPVDRGLQWSRHRPITTHSRSSRRLRSTTLRNQLEHRQWRKKNSFSLRTRQKLKIMLVLCV